MSKTVKTVKTTDKSKRVKVKRRKKKINYKIDRSDNTNNVSLMDILPWVEKYRPSNFDDIILHPSIRRTIKSMIENKYLKNIILEGPPGVGKTTTVKCVAKELYGKYYDQMVMEINASDNRGIKVKDVISKFIKLCVEIEEEDMDKIPKFKLIIMDEADNMTDKAKHNITNFLEAENDKVRFSFTCNTKDNISTGIQSKCYAINYPLLPKDFIESRLKYICEQEDVYESIEHNIEYDDIKSKKERTKLINEGLKEIIFISNGDLRKAINILQFTYDRYNFIDKEKVYSMYDKPHPNESLNIIEACINQDFKRGYEISMNMIKRGYSVADITGGLVAVIKSNDICGHINEEYRIELIDGIGYSQYNVSKGLELSKIQAAGCIADMCKIIKTIKSNQ